MSDITRRRRRLGHGLIAAGALALPLTASFSYSAGAQVPEPPAPPSPQTPEAPLSAPLPLASPDRPETDQREVRTLVFRHHDGAEEGEHSPVVQQFTLRRQTPVAPVPPVPPVPTFEFHGWGNPEDPEFEARMEEFGRQMEEWGKSFGEQYAAQARAQALALAEAGRNTPEIVESCDEKEMRRTRTADGRTRVVICERQIELAARNGLRQARNAIARNREMSEAVRAEILQDLDEEIERIERDRN